MFDMTSSVATSDAVAEAIASLPTLPDTGRIYGASMKPADFLNVVRVANDAAPAILTDGHVPTVKLTGARAKTSDTAADALFAELLAADGGALTLVAVTSTVADSGRAKNNASQIASQLDAAWRRLGRSDQDRIIYGRASDTLVDATVHGVTFQVPAPGLFYVMATGGAVKSHPVMGKIYRAITGAGKP